MFRTVSLFIIRSFPLYTQQWCVSHRFADSLRAARNAKQVKETYQYRNTPRTLCKANATIWYSKTRRVNSVLILPANCQQTSVTYTTAVFTVKTSWWWTEELSETCRILFQKYIWEIGSSSWFFYRNFSRCTVTLSWSCLQAVSKTVWHIPLLCVQWKTPDDRQGTVRSM